MALSGGVPRVINLLCDRSLMVASQRQVSRITEDHVVGAATHLSIDVPKNKVKGESADDALAPSRWRWAAAAAVVLVVVLGGTAALFGNPFGWFDAGSDPPLPRVPDSRREQGAPAAPPPATSGHLSSPPTHPPPAQPEQP